MKIVTWNVNSLKVRLPHLIDWLTAHQPDVIALQELKMVEEAFPLDVFSDLGYASYVSGQKTYNGVALLSKLPLTNVSKQIPNFVDEQQRVIAGTYHDIRIINVYIPNGSSIDSEKYIYKLNWLKAFENYISKELLAFPKMIILGDFNIAPENEDVHDPAAWQDQVLFSKPEREHFQVLLNMGFVDSFRLFTQPEKSYSWWDYRELAFRRNRGLRIDHILVSQALQGRCQACIIDKGPRKLERPSDHAPVLLTLNEVAETFP